MKIIHTSDWHLGQIFNEYDRVQEHTAFFERLKAIVENERPDALLVSGDIYHNSVPSSSTQRLYTDAVLELKKACPDMTVVVTAGNHDSPSRLEVDRNLWDCLDVKTVGSLSRYDGIPDPEKHIIRIPSGDGGTAGFVVALPHVYRQNYPAADTVDPVSGNDVTESGNTGRDDGYTRQKALYKTLLDMVSERNPGRLPVVMMAHLAVTGCDISGHEEPVGGMEYTPLDSFPEGYDYLALGHIHRPQTLRSTARKAENKTGEFVTVSPVARYSGSPVPVSFDEDYIHSVSIVEIEGPDSRGQKTVRIRQEEIPQTIPVKTIPGHPVPFEEALEALKKFPDDEKAYIRLNVMIKDFLPPDASVQAIAAAGGKECRYCSMKVTRETESREDAAGKLTIEEIRSSSPVDIARLYYRRKFGSVMDAELESMLEEVTKEETEKTEEE